MMNIGNRPTVSGKERSIEINIFNFDQNIYKKEIKIILKKFLRKEIKFEGLDELKTQLALDKEMAIELN